MYLMLATLANYNGTFAENAKEAGIVTLIGMVAIFSVLAILWGVIELLHFGLNLPAKRKAKKANAAVADPLVSDPVVPAAEQPDETDDGAIIAAITAAITAARAEEGQTTGFRVVSFRRTSR